MRLYVCTFFSELARLAGSLAAVGLVVGAMALLLGA